MVRPPGLSQWTIQARFHLVSRSLRQTHSRTHTTHGWGPFCYHRSPFCYQNTRILPYSTRILPVFYTFPKTDRILQNTSRTHKNTQEYEHVEECERHIHRKCENTTEYRQNTASRWYSLRIHTEYGGLQNTTQEYRAEYARNTQKNTVFFIVFRIRQRIRYFPCRIPTSIAFAAFARPCGRLLDEGDRARLCVNWVAIPIQGGGHNSGFYLFCFWCLLPSALLSFLLTASVEMPAPLPSSFCFPAALFVLLLLLQAVGGRSERKKVTHEVTHEAGRTACTVSCEQ